MKREEYENIKKFKQKNRWSKKGINEFRVVTWRKMCVKKKDQE